MLASHQLDAFLAVAETRAFTKAARRVGLTQSALSQRIANLEATLGLTLFLRERAGARLTDAGERLLRYCRAQGELETELLASLGTGASHELAGIVRVAGFSTIVRSRIIPALSELVRESPRVEVQIASREMRDLPVLLRTGEAELVLVDRALALPGVEAHEVGEERCVLVEPTRATRRTSYLDHDIDDPTTVSFLRAHADPARALSRSFLDDIYGILDGVAAGWGRAVVPEHLLPYRGVRVVRGKKPVRAPIVLHRRVQPFYSELHQRAFALLLAAFPRTQ